MHFMARPVPVAGIEHPHILLYGDEGFSSVNDFVLEFDDGKSAPLRLLPTRMQEPLPHFFDEEPQVLRVAPHDLVKLGVLARPEKHSRQAKLEILVVQAEGFEKRLAK